MKGDGRRQAGVTVAASLGHVPYIGPPPSSPPRLARLLILLALLPHPLQKRREVIPSPYGRRQTIPVRGSEVGRGRVPVRNAPSGSRNWIRNRSTGDGSHHSPGLVGCAVAPRVVTLSRCRTRRQGLGLPHGTARDLAPQARGPCPPRTRPRFSAQTTTNRHFLAIDDFDEGQGLSTARTKLPARLLTYLRCNTGTVLPTAGTYATAAGPSLLQLTACPASPRLASQPRIPSAMWLLEHLDNLFEGSLVSPSTECKATAKQ